MLRTELPSPSIAAILLMSAVGDYVKDLPEHMQEFIQLHLQEQESDDDASVKSDDIDVEHRTNGINGEQGAMTPSKGSTRLPTVEMESSDETPLGSTISFEPQARGCPVFHT